LIGRALGEPFTSFADSLFNDRAVVGSWQRDDNREDDTGRNDNWPYTTAETMNYGWCWRIDLPHRVSRGYVFSSQFATDAEADAELRRKNPLITGPVRFVPFRSGRYERTWVKNVVAVGNASGFVEPLESTGLHMAMETIVAVCRSLIDTDRRIVPSMCDMVNRFLGEMWDDVRAFLAVHFRFNRRADTPYWRHCREATNLAAAEPIVDFYRHVGPTQIGHMFLPRQSVFGYRGYLTLLAGQRVETDFRYEMSPGEAEMWRQHLGRVSAAADAALPVPEALRLVAEGQASPPGVGS
jgi:tryptophan halogenase